MERRTDIVARDQPDPPTDPTTQAPPTGATAVVAAPEDWVPVERRWLGLDRRSIAPALVVLAFALLAHLVLPMVNAALSYDEETSAGDVMLLKEGVSFAPAAGWSIESGIVEGDEPVSGSRPASTRLTEGQVSYEVTVGEFDGTSADLLDQLKETTDALNDSAGLHVTSDPATISTQQGVEGVIARFSGESSDGALAAFVHDGVGVEIVSTAPTTADRETTEEIAEMIVALRFDGEDAA